MGRIRTKESISNEIKQLESEQQKLKGRLTINKKKIKSLQAELEQFDLMQMLAEMKKEQLSIKDVKEFLNSKK